MRHCTLLFTLLLLGSFAGQAQKMTFSEYNKKDNRDIFFEILGKFDTTYIVYKNITRKHQITRYNADMKVIDNIPLDFMPERAFNVDFVSYPTHFFIIYQYQRSNIVYCNGAKIGADGKILSGPETLDTTKIGYFADNKIYSTTFSEDRQKILIFKRHIKFDNLTTVTKLFDANLKVLDSTRQYFRFDERREVYSDMFVDNGGAILFAKETRKSAWDNSGNLDIIIRNPGVDSFKTLSVSLEKKFIEEVGIKIDNLNKNYIINSFYYGSRRGNVQGLFTALVDKEGKRPVRTAFNVFADSLRSKINSTDNFKFVFDNLSVQNVVVKKNGGFIIAAEDFYTETMSINNSWNRNFLFNSMPYSAVNDFYLYNPQFYNYRPYNSFNRDISTRYYYNDIVVASIDSSLKLQWNSLIHKKQFDVDNDNYLSYGLLNVGGEIHFFFIDKDRNRQIVNNHSVNPSGEIKRYATLKSNEKGYTFMPRLAKQVGARQVIMPYIYLSRIGYAKIDF